MAFSFFFRSIVLGLVAFVCGVMGVQGQTPVVTLNIETPPKKSALKAHDHLTFKISGINLFDYNITVNGTALNFATDPPKALEKISEGFSPKFTESAPSIKTACDSLNEFSQRFVTISANINNLDDDQVMIARQFIKKFEKIYFIDGLLTIKTTCQRCTPSCDENNIMNNYNLAKTAITSHLKKADYIYTIKNIPKADMLKLDYSIVPKEGTLLNSQTTVGSYEIPIKGGLKIDFSAGLAGTSLINQSFYVKDSVPTNADLKRGKIKENPKFPFDLGPAAFMHFYCRSGRLCNLGGNFGIMTNTEGDLRYLLGGSLMFGIKTRFCLNTGVTVGKVKELRDDYRQALGNDYTNVSSKDDLYINRFKVGFYFGFSVSAFQSKSVSLTPEKK